ncbi:MAG: hypothetical protein KatS3mg010_0992 [Acidimicrobiia bacterium]|nr:MAG: hypothetical protein KatS3mg010_0992 [Acidimicrobiia bacterium]
MTIATETSGERPKAPVRPLRSRVRSYTSSAERLTHAKPNATAVERAANARNTSAVTPHGASMNHQKRARSAYHVTSPSRPYCIGTRAGRSPPVRAA